MKTLDAGHGDSPLIPTPEGWTGMARRPGGLDHTASLRPVWASVFPNHSRFQFWESSWDVDLLAVLDQESAYFRLEVFSPG